MKKQEAVIWGLMDALGVIVYVFLVYLIMENLAPSGDEPGAFGPFVFLLLFVLSAAVVGSLIFGKPVLLYLEGHKKEGVQVFLYTLGWLFLAVAIALFTLL